LRRHLLAVVCRDQGEDVSKWSRADVVVDVAPPNDNPPHFERQMYDCDVTADSGSAVDDVITTVKAVDVDAGVSGQVCASRVVLNQSVSQSFCSLNKTCTVKTTTGTDTVVLELDGRPTKQYHWLPDISYPNLFVLRRFCTLTVQSQGRPPPNSRPEWGHGGKSALSRCKGA